MGEHLERVGDTYDAVLIFRVGAASRQLSLVRQMCPKARGYDGGLVSTAEMAVDEESLTMRLRYTAPHAHIIHERRYYKHKPGEQAKFIEQPLDQNKGAYLKKVADAIGGKVR